MLRHHFPALMFALTLVACTAGPSPREYLDEKTAATVTAASKPLVFARERPELAAHSREYVTLTAASVNQGGKVDYYLFAYSWSTVDRRDVSNNGAAADELIIAADDRQIRPPTSGQTPAQAGVGIPIGAPPGHHWTLHVYRSDLATLRFLSEARQLSVVVISPEGPATYDLWSDQRASLRGLVQRLEGRD